MGLLADVRVLGLALLGAVAPLAPGAPPLASGESGHQYCIVGAGPAGVQLGHFFRHAGRDYVIYEINGRAGSFFERFPRHRTLISLNKRFVREGRSAEFAFRHDWNSLIDVRGEGNRTRPMTERSKALFPHADVLAQYLAEFAEEQRDAIRYGVHVDRISRAGAGGGFELELAIADADGDWRLERAHCGEVIVASGLRLPRGVKARVDGAAHVEGYEDLPDTGEAYEGKAVVVLGIGNAALETAQELQKYTAELHVYGRPRVLPDGDYGVRFAYQTHYVGDIRAGRTTILDTYLLKSLDTLDFAALGDRRRLAVIPCNGTRLCIWIVEESECADEQCRREFAVIGQGLNYWLDIGVFKKGGDADRRLRQLLATYPETDWSFQDHVMMLPEHEAAEEEFPVSAEERMELRAELGIQEEVFGGEYVEVRVTSALLRKHPGLSDALVPFRAERSFGNGRYPVDHIIRCFGWAMDTSIFDDSVPVVTTHNRKYPKITPGYEAEGVPGLHFAGALAHGLDFRRSAGGFIHGFRYTARALFRLLEEKNFGARWPGTEVPLYPEAGGAGGVDKLVDLLQLRINEASGPYQMFQALGDMVVFNRSSAAGGWTASYLEEVPLDLFAERFVHLPRLTWVFRYGDGFHGAKVLGRYRVGSTNPFTAELSNFLHPMICYFPAGQTEPAMRHYLTEDIFTSWLAEEFRHPLARFVALAVANVTRSPVSADGEVSAARDAATSTGEVAAATATAGADEGQNCTATPELGCRARR